MVQSFWKLLETALGPFTQTTVVTVIFAENFDILEVELFY